MTEAGFVELVPGFEPEPRTFGPISRTDIVRYQGASGDFHPAHHDDDFARRHGYPRAFSLGMLAAGYLSTYAADWLGAESLRRFRVRFMEITWPGDRLVCSGKVLKTWQSDGSRYCDVELACRRSSGELAVQGWATFIVREETCKGERE